MSKAQIVRLISTQLSTRDERPELDVRLSDLADSPAALKALRAIGYVTNSGHPAFTRRVLQLSWPCAGEQGCLRIPFGHNAPPFGPLVELFSEGLGPPQSLWTVWAQHRVVADDALSSAAARGGFVDTLDAADGKCPERWRPSTILLLSMALPTPDSPATIDATNPFYLHGHSNLTHGPNDIQCARASYDVDIDDGPAKNRINVP